MRNLFEQKGVPCRARKRDKPPSQWQSMKQKWAASRFKLPKGVRLNPFPMAVWLAGGIPYSVVDVLNAPPELFDIIGADFELAQLRYTFVNVGDIERESVQNAFHRRLQAMGVSEGRRTMICPWWAHVRGLDVCAKRWAPQAVPYTAAGSARNIFFVICREWADHAVRGHVFRVIAAL